MKDSTPHWIYEPIIDERLYLTTKHGFSRSSPAPYWKTNNAQVIYRCTSCHASALPEGIQNNFSKSSFIGMTEKSVQQSLFKQ